MVRCLYLKCSGGYPGQEHDENNCRGYCCWYCKALNIGTEARAGKRKHYKGHCTGDYPESQFASPSIGASAAGQQVPEEGRPAAASSTGELPGDESARRMDDDDDSFQDSSSDNEAAAASPGGQRTRSAAPAASNVGSSCGAEIPPPESLGEVHREDAHRQTDG